MPKAITAEEMDQQDLSEEERAALAEEADADDDQKEGSGTTIGAPESKKADDKPDDKPDDKSKADDKSKPDDKAAESKTDDKSDGAGPAKAKDDSEVLPQASDESKSDGASPDPSKAEDVDDAGKPVAKDGEDKETDEAAAAAAAEAGTEDHQLLTDSFRPQLAAREIPEDLDARVTANTEAIEALDKSLEEGDIDYAAHAKANRDLVGEMTDLRALQREAEFTNANNEMSQQQHWEWEVERFVEENDQFKSPVIYGALRGALEDLYATEENVGNSYRWFLREAAKGVNEAFNLNKPVAVADPAKADADAADVTKADDLGKAVDDAAVVEAPPKTLANVPAASPNAEQQDPFAKLDDMEGMELEEELAKMSQSDKNKYLDTRTL